MCFDGLPFTDCAIFDSNPFSYLELSNRLPYFGIKLEWFETKKKAPILFKCEFF